MIKNIEYDKKLSEQNTKKNLNKDIVNVLQNQKQELDKTYLSIKDKITYIVQSIGKVFEYQVYNWYFDHNNFYDDCNGCNEDYNNIIEILSFDFVRIIQNSANYSSPKNILDKNGNKCNLALGFPKHWLFEDFEEELRNGKILLNEFYKNKNLKKKEKLAAIKSKLAE